MSTAWKAFELRVAKAWGGTRSGPTGRDGPDVAGVPLAIQCKRTTRVGIRGSWIVQAQLDGKRLGQPWVLVVAQHGDRRPVAVVDHDWLVQLWKEHEEFGEALIAHLAEAP